jgi:hypothetical protein
MNIEALRTMIMDQPPEQLVGELAENSTTLKDLHNRFRIASSKMHILSVYETVPTPTVTFDVSKYSLKFSGQHSALTLIQLYRTASSGGSEMVRQSFS